MKSKRGLRCGVGKIAFPGRESFEFQVFFDRGISDRHVNQSSIL